MSVALKYEKQSLLVKTLRLMLLFINMLSFMTVFVSLVYACAIACSAFLLLQIGIWSSHMSQHVYLCVTGYVILMSVAIMSYDPSTSWSRHLKYQEKRTSHVVLQIIGSALAVAGSSIRIINLNNNFQTAHGILGWVAMIMTILSLLGGFFNLFLPGNQHRVLIKTIHSCFGSITLIIAFICLCFGFHTTFRAVFGDQAANACVTLTIFALVGVIFSPTVNTYYRIFKK